MTSELGKNYGQILQDLKERIRQARLRSSHLINNELLVMYWEIGKAILEQKEQQGWGSKVIKQLAIDLKMEFPEMKGFSDRNLVYMQSFAASYPHFVITQQSAAQLQVIENKDIIITQQSAAKLPWGHHQVILDKLKTSEERLFYIQNCAQNGWSRDILVHQIESGLHNRQGALIHNFKNTLPSYQSELTQQLFKDPYQLDFIMLGKNAKERDLENTLMLHVTKFLLELGVGFAFMERQKRFEAGGREFFIDLLFYHTKLRSHIIIELKIGEFEPEFVSKMNLYLGLADDNLKGEHDEPSIGLILCKTKNKIVAEYALRDTSKPIGIAEYKIAEMLPEDIKGELPSIEQVEKEMENEIKQLETPFDNKVSRLKKMLEGLKGEEVNEKKNSAITKKILEKVIIPLNDRIIEMLRPEISPLFEQSKFLIWVSARGFYSAKEAKAYLKEIRDAQDFRIEVYLEGFKKAGVKAFDCRKELHVKLDQYKYNLGFKMHGQEPVYEKLYHQFPSEEELTDLANKMGEFLLDDITLGIERIKNN